MQHRFPHSGAASPNQLSLFEEESAQPKCCDVAPAPQLARSESSALHHARVLRVKVLGLAAVAAMSGPIALSVARALVVDALHSGISGNGDTVKDTLTCARKFFDFAANHGLETLDEIDERFVMSFIYRAARQKNGTYRDVVRSTLRNRRSYLKRTFKTLQMLGLWDGPIPVGDPIPSRTADATRPLTCDEMHRVRVQAYYPFNETRIPLIVALSEAGGSAGEIAAVGLTDLNLENGTVHFGGPEARTNRIPAEALAALRIALPGRDWSGQRRLVGKDDLIDNFAKRSVTQALSDVIRSARLSRVPLVSGRSIRLHQGLNLFHSDGLGAAMRFLGSHSADTTMRSLGLTRDDI